MYFTFSFIIIQMKLKGKQANTPKLTKKDSQVESPF